MSRNRRAFFVLLFVLCLGAGYLALRFPLAPPEPIQVECARKCHPLAWHIRVKELHPLLPGGRRRNIVERPECVCGTL